MHALRRSLGSAAVITLALAALACSVPFLGDMGAATPAEATAAAPADDAAPATEQPAAEAPAAEQPADTGGSGLCDHPYFPIGDGRVFRYESYGPDGLEQYTRSYVQSGPDTFTMTVTFTDLEVKGDWLCSTGGLVQAQYGTLTTSAAQDFTYTTENFTGEFLPTEDRFTPGSTWQVSYDVTANTPPEAGGMTAVGTAVITGTLEGFEPVSVPVDDYPEAAKVRYDYAVSLNMNIGNTQTPVELTFTTYIWFVRDVGIVKEVVDLFDLETTSELIAFE